MKKSLKNIIKENKSTFENEQVPGFVWDHIENELHPEKKRRGGWKLWTGMGLSAAAATALVFVLIKPSNEEYVYHEEQKQNELVALEDTSEELRYFDETATSIDALQEKKKEVTEYKAAQESLAMEEEDEIATKKEHFDSNTEINLSSNIVQSETPVYEYTVPPVPVYGNMDDSDREGGMPESVISNIKSEDSYNTNQAITKHKPRSKRRDRSSSFVTPGDVSVTTTYDNITENTFKTVTSAPLSTFSIDVDVASYADVRGYINRSQRPPADAVRIEEMINYFNYDLPNPTGEVPFSVSTQVGTCPWNPEHYLLQVAMKGRDIPTQKLPANNLVFLLDVSGSMASPDKLELLKKGFRLLVNEMRPKDRIAIVVYAGAAGVVLTPTSGAEKETIMAALDQLKAGGSTAGGEGLELAYNLAEENFQEDGNNRIILATDGDFNVGISDDKNLTTLIEEKRETGIYLTVLGFGKDNYQSSKMEKLADNGNGNMAYIDNILEAKKVLVTEMGATLLTIAKDVKLQLEFNPEHIAEYRLIGYENRLLENKDFNDDTKDAGELGSGHTIIALYELIPVNASKAEANKLRYQSETALKPTKQFNDELLLVKLRYKEPKGSKSKLVSVPVYVNDVNEVNQDFYFAASVAEFGMLLRKSEYSGNASFQTALELAQKGMSYDPGKYRAAYLELLEKVILLRW